MIACSSRPWVSTRRWRFLPLIRLSERRACDLIGIALRVARYRPSRADDAGLRQRLRELAAERRRFGYRRLGYLLAREGLAPNHKKLLRLYRKRWFGTLLLSA